MEAVQYVQMAGSVPVVRVVLLMLSAVHQQQQLLALCILHLPMVLVCSVLVMLICSQETA
jgi:hypothetical protein